MNDAVPAIEVCDLTVRYRATVALESCNLVIPRQSIMGLVGPNGAGKSTLLKAILDLVPRSAGQVRVFGKPFSTDRQAIGYVPQKSSIDWDFPVTVRDMVLMGSYGKLGWFRRPGKLQKEQTQAALERVGMQDCAQRQIGELSGGQQQRAFLARAFVQDAPIFFLDEPFTGVDTMSEKTIVRLLHELRDEGKTIVIVQHDLTTINDYVDHITLINRQVVASGTVQVAFTDDNIQSAYQDRSQRDMNALCSGHSSPVEGREH